MIVPRNIASRMLGMILCQVCCLICFSGTMRAQDLTKQINAERLEQLHVAIEKLAAERRALEPRSGPYREVRANLHVHSLLSHDSRGKIEDIIAAAKAARTEVLMFTEHPSDKADFFLDGHSGLRDGVLLIPGAEMKGFLVYPTESLKPFQDAEREELCRIVRNRDGLVFLSHLEERMDWQIPGLTGVEIYNTHADYKKQKRIAEAMRNPLWFLQMADLVRRYPQESLSALQTYPDDYLKRWDELCKIAPHTGVAANDAHENVGIRLRLAADNQVAVEDALGEEVIKLNRLIVAPLLNIPKDATVGTELFRLQLDKYENSLRHVGTHLLVKELSRESVWDALSAGRAFVAFDWIADSSGFDASVISPDTPERYEIGSRMRWKQNMKIEARSPLPCTWRLMRSGEEVTVGQGKQFEYELKEPGIYRIESRLQVAGEERIWVLINPFYIEP